jgi:hypothetical protein
MGIRLSNRFVAVRLKTMSNASLRNASKAQSANQLIKDSGQKSHWHVAHQSRCDGAVVGASQG